MGRVASELAREAAVPMRRVGKTELVERVNVEAFLAACESAGARVVGIEGFRIAEARLEPDMEWIADFSELSDPGESIACARQFTSEAPPALAFDFVVVHPDA